MEIKVGSKVRVIRNLIKEGNKVFLRDNYIGRIATVKEIKHKSSMFPNHIHVLEFEDESIQKKYVNDGCWLWSFNELELVPEVKEVKEVEVIPADSFKFELEVEIEEVEKVRVVIDGDRKTIYSFPAIIHIITIGEKQFKGVAKCLEDDIYDEIRGTKIAVLKAEIKEREYRLKKLVK